MMSFEESCALVRLARKVADDLASHIPLKLELAAGAYASPRCCYRRRLSSGEIVEIEVGITIRPADDQDQSAVSVYEMVQAVEQETAKDLAASNMVVLSPALEVFLNRFEDPQALFEFLRKEGFQLSEHPCRCSVPDFRGYAGRPLSWRCMSCGGRPPTDQQVQVQYLPGKRQPVPVGEPLDAADAVWGPVEGGTLDELVVDTGQGHLRIDLKLQQDLVDVCRELVRIANLIYPSSQTDALDRFLPQAEAVLKRAEELSPAGKPLFGKEQP